MLLGHGCFHRFDFFFRQVVEVMDRLVNMAIEAYALVFVVGLVLLRFGFATATSGTVIFS